MHAIGIDMESIGRFDLNRKKYSHFFEKIYTPSELEYCFGKNNPKCYLAVRFAAKEAMVKALSNLGYDEIDYSGIEIHSKNGIPDIKLHDERFKKIRVMVSLSHTTEHAIAMCLCEQ